MKIIKQGFLAKDSVHRGECRSCGTVVEFTRSEACLREGRYNETMLEVQCPTCDKKIYTDVSERQTPG